MLCVARGLELGGNLFGEVDGDGEADALPLGVDGGVDADNLAGHVDERPTGISGVDAGVGLQEVGKDVAAARHDIAALLGADDACGNAGAEAEGVADGDDPVADAGAVGIAEWNRADALEGGDADKREVGGGVAADDGGLELAVVVEFDADVAGSLDDMEVGQDVALVIDDESRAEAGADLAAHGSDRVVGDLGGVEIDDALLDLLDEVGEGAGGSGNGYDGRAGLGPEGACGLAELDWR